MLYKREYLIFLSLITLHVIPIWLFNNFSTADSWTHNYNTFLLNEYHFGDFSYFREFYQKNTSLDPNLFTNYFQLLIAKLFSFGVSDKIIMSLYIILFPLSIRYAIQAINKDSVFIAVLSIPITYNAVMLLGFHSFILSFPVAFFLVGYFFRHSDNWTITSAFVFSLFSVILYFTHIVAFGITFIALGIFNLVYIIQRSISPSEEVSLSFNNKIIRNRLIIPFLAIIPALILIGLFLYDHPPSASMAQEAGELPPPLARIKILATMFYYRFADTSTLVFLFPFLLLISSLVSYYIYNKWKYRQFTLYDILFAVLIAEFIVYIFIPTLKVENGKGGSGGFMEQRLVPYLLAFSILLTSVTCYTKQQKKIIIAVTSILSIGLLLMNSYYFKQVDEQLDEFFSGDHLYEPHSTLLAITGKRGGYQADNSRLTEASNLTFIHASSKTCLNKKLIHLENVEADFGYFSMQYKNERNPFTIMNTKNMVNPKIDIMSYENKTGRAIDYYAIWLGRKTFKEGTTELDDNMQAIYTQLDKHYNKVFTSERGLMEIYKHK